MGIAIELVQVLGKLRLPERQPLTRFGFADHARQQRDRRCEMKLGERKPARVEIVEGERGVRVDDDGALAHPFGEPLIGKSFLDDEGVVERCGGLQKQIVHRLGLAGAGHAEDHGVLRRAAGLGADADEIAVAAVIDRLRGGKGADKRRGEGEQVREVGVFRVEFTVPVGRVGPARP